MGERVLCGRGVPSAYTQRAWRLASGVRNDVGVLTALLAGQEALIGFGEADKDLMVTAGVGMEAHGLLAVEASELAVAHLL